MEEKDMRICPVCGKEVERKDMNFTRDCHGITFRLVCYDCWEKLMEKGYDGQYYSEADECIDEDYQKVKNMISTLERDNCIEGILFRKMKELPDWYGISDVGYIWHGEWNDPEIEYKGKRINATIVEDTMWERWIRDDDGRLIEGRESDDDGFKKFMLDNKDEVYELIELAMESEEQIRN